MRIWSFVVDTTMTSMIYNKNKQFKPLQEEPYPACQSGVHNTEVAIQSLLLHQRPRSSEVRESNHSQTDAWCHLAAGHLR